MKATNQIIGTLAIGISLAVSLISNTHAALTPEQRARIEESTRELEAAMSNMMAQVEAARAARPPIDPQAAALAAAQAAAAREQAWQQALKEAAPNMRSLGAPQDAEPPEARAA